MPDLKALQRAAVNYFYFVKVSCSTYRKKCILFSFSMSALGKNVFGKTKSNPSRYRYLFLFLAVFGGSLLLISMNHHSEFLYVNNSPELLWKFNRYKIGNDSTETFTIKTEGCTISGMQPFEKNIKKFVVRPTEVKNCLSNKNPLLLSNDTHIWVDTDVLQSIETTNVTCCYNSFYRPLAIANIMAFDVDDRVEYNGCREFTSHIEVQHEFVKVSCGYEDKVLHEEYFLFAVKKPLSTSRDNITSLNQSAYNVIVMGIDSISRLNFHRTMPKTLAYLQKRGAIELHGYNKVGDNTFPNIIPMLLGIKDTDLKRTCWPRTGATFDNCPFIWQWYKEAGFYTSFGEDSALLGTFNYDEKIGFSGSPTDYYLRTFMHEAEVHAASNKDFNCFLCLGNKYFYKILLDYVESLTRKLSTSKLFGFFWEISMSHDYLNYPMLMDNSYEKFFERLDSFKYLDNTVFILLSDHGMRWGKIRYTKQGRLEERLPFVHILLPPSFRESYRFAYDNIKRNSKRLTTPFDIHATLSDLVDLSSIRDELIQRRTKTDYTHSTGISLFLPIPGNRTCRTAGIEDHWCTCHTYSKVGQTSEDSYEASAYLVEHLNSLLRDHRQCAELSLDEVMEVREFVSGSEEEGEVGWREFMVVARMVPGGGVFEATLRQEASGWAVVGTPSRLNLYGDESRCVHHYQLKLYCYCK